MVVALEGMARVLATRRIAAEAPAHAVQLLGAAAALRTAGAAPFPDQVPDPRAMADLHATLGEAGWSARWAAGQALTEEQASSLALAHATISE
jgi:hypothetical protein